MFIIGKSKITLFSSDFRLFFRLSLCYTVIGSIADGSPVPCLRERDAHPFIWKIFLIFSLLTVDSYVNFRV